MPKRTDRTLQLQFGEHLRQLREGKNLSLSDLASRCDIDKSNISKIENGRFNIQLSKIFELAKGLEISAKDMLDFK